MDIGHVTWRKASYSGGNGGNCIEVGVWRNAGHSGANRGECVESGTAYALVAVRDSKNPYGPKLAFDPSIWHTFVHRLQDHSL